jgi:two-component system, NtrC family, sensor kinase
MKTVSIPAPKILLVDDNHDGLVVRRSLLQEAGFQVQTAACGEEAIGVLSSADFDVVVTDYRMPAMNGTELIARIRVMRPRARIILLSGFVEPLGLTEENTGADAVMAKSANEPAHLLRLVKRMANTAARRKPPQPERGKRQAPPRAGAAEA